MSKKSLRLPALLIFGIYTLYSCVLMPLENYIFADILLFQTIWGDVIDVLAHWFEIAGIAAILGTVIYARYRYPLRELPPMKVYDAEYAPEDAYVGGGKETVIRRENDTFYVEGEWLVNLMGQINFSDYESLNFFQRVLQRSGVFEALEAKGCRDGHTVSIYDFEFEYVK